LKIYTINYDLRKQRNYERLYEAIRSYGSYAHVMESMWVILSNNSAVKIRDHLAQYVDNDDRLMVARATGEAAWLNLSDENSQWLKRNLSANTIA